MGGCLKVFLVGLLICVIITLCVEYPLFGVAVVAFLTYCGVAGYKDAKKKKEAVEEKQPAFLPPRGVENEKKDAAPLLAPKKETLAETFTRIETAARDLAGPGASAEKINEITMRLLKEEQTAKAARRGRLAHAYLKGYEEGRSAGLREQTAKTSGVSPAAAAGLALGTAYLLHEHREAEAASEERDRLARELEERDYGGSFDYDDYASNDTDGFDDFDGGDDFDDMDF